MSAENTKKIVLAIDDVSMNLAMIQNALSGYFDVRTAKSAELALYILGSVKVDLILLDIEMPGMSGLELATVLRDIPAARDIPIIFVTSHAQPTTISKAVRAGAKDYIVKPIVPKVLCEKAFGALNLPMPR